MNTRLKNKQKDNNLSNVIEFKKYKGYEYNPKKDIKTVQDDNLTEKVVNTHKMILSIDEVADCLLNFNDKIVDLELSNYILIKGKDSDLTKKAIAHLSSSIDTLTNKLTKISEQLKTKIL